MVLINTWNASSSPINKWRKPLYKWLSLKSYTDWYKYWLLIKLIINVHNLTVQYYLSLCYKIVHYFVHYNNLSSSTFQIKPVLTGNTCIMILFISTSSDFFSLLICSRLRNICLSNYGRNMFLIKQKHYYLEINL